MRSKEQTRVPGSCSSWQVYDVMGVGVAKQKHDLHKMSLKDRPTTEPEEVKLADRAQMNQVRLRQ